MMKQQTLAMAADQGEGFEQHRRATRRDVFLATMEQIVPWSQLCEVIEPHYPKAGKGRPPVGLERMLRMYFVQHWFNLADEACDEALLDSTALRRFVGIDLGRERVPDATTLLKFRRLLEHHELDAALFTQVNQTLQARGMKIGTGTIVDATIIAAPSSTKNLDKARDPEMHQTRKGQQWYFGMKMHIGVDSRTGLVHSAAVTAANVHDKHLLEDLLHGEERRVYGDSAYAGQKPLIREHAPHAKDFTNQRTRVAADPKLTHKGCFRRYFSEPHLRASGQSVFQLDYVYSGSLEIRRGGPISGRRQHFGLPQRRLHLATISPPRASSAPFAAPPITTLFTRSSGRPMSGCAKIGTFAAAAA